MDQNFQVSSATFSYAFQNFSKIIKIQHSPACWIRNLPWKIFIEPVMRDGIKYLSVFVGCTEPITETPWSCRASVRMYKLHGIRPKIVRTTNSLVFDSTASISWGHVQFSTWNELIDPTNGYIKNDSITLEVTIEAEMPLGLRLTSKHFTDERANTALKAYETSLETQKRRIEELLSENENLNSKHIAVSKELENLKNDLQQEKVNFIKQMQTHQTTSVNQQKKIADLDNDNKELKVLISQEKKACVDIKRDLQDKTSLVLKLTEDLKDARQKLQEPAQKDEFENELLNQKLSSTADNQNVRKSNQEGTNVQLLKQQTTEDLDCKAIIEEKNKLQTDLSSISEQLTEAKEKITSMEVKNDKEVNDLKTENERLKLSISSLNQKLSDSIEKSKLSENDINKLNAEKLNLITKLNTGYEKYNKLKSEKGVCETKLNSINDQLNRAQDQIDKLSQNLKQCQSSNSNTAIGNALVQKTKLESEIDQLNSDLGSMRKNMATVPFSHSLKLDELQLGTNKFEYEIQLVKSELKLAQANKAKYEQDTERLNTEKNNLQENINVVQAELEKMKTEAKESENLRKQIEEFEREKKDLNSQISSLTNQLTQTKQDILNSNSKLKSIEEKSTQGTERMASIKTNENSQLAENRSGRDIKELADKCRESNQAKVKLECGIENLRINFERQIKNADEINQQQKNKFLRAITDLEVQLEDEKREKLETIESKTSLEDALKDMKDRNDALDSVKNRLVIQVKDYNLLTMKALNLVRELGSNLGSSGKLPNSIAEHLNFIVKSMNNLELLKCDRIDVLPANEENNNSKSRSDYNSGIPNNIENKICDLELQMQEKNKMISELYSAEIVENQKLKTMVHQLSALLDNEILMCKQYKDLAKFADSRIDALRIQLEESDNKLYSERRRGNRSKIECDRLSKHIQDLEAKLSELKQSLWSKAMKMVEYPTSNCKVDVVNPSTNTEMISQNLPSGSGTTNELSNGQKNITEIS